MGNATRTEEDICVPSIQSYYGFKNSSDLIMLADDDAGTNSAVRRRQRWRRSELAGARGQLFVMSFKSERKLMIDPQLI